MNENIFYGKLRIIRFLIDLMMIAPNSHVHKEGKEKGRRRGGEGGVRKNLRGGGGATQSATCCTMRKRVEWGLDTRGL